MVIGNLHVGLSSLISKLQKEHEYNSWKNHHDWQGIPNTLKKKLSLQSSYDYVWIVM